MSNNRWESLFLKDIFLRKISVIGKPSLGSQQHTIDIIIPLSILQNCLDICILNLLHRKLKRTYDLFSHRRWRIVVSYVMEETGHTTVNRRPWMDNHYTGCSGDKKRHAPAISRRNIVNKDEYRQEHY